VRKKAAAKSGSAGAAREAAIGAAKSLRDWTTIICVAAVPIVAHWLATNRNSSENLGLIYGASFAVFALILPAVGILRDYMDRRMARLMEVLSQGSEATTDVLESQSRMFKYLTTAVAPLQRGIVFATIAAGVSSAALVVPKVTLWNRAPSFMTFSFTEMLTAIALVCLVSTVIAMFPFTWHLLVRSDQLKFMQETIQSAINKQNQAASTAAAQQNQHNPKS
jgi:hypothetical protein